MRRTPFRPHERRDPEFDAPADARRGVDVRDRPHVQHTAWDYGKNGKGFYNDIFAPGWTVASLWQMLTPDRVTKFFANR